MHRLTFICIITLMIFQQGYSQDSLPALPPPLDNSGHESGEPAFGSVKKDIADRQQYVYDRSAFKTVGITMFSISYGLALTVDLILPFSDNETDHRVAKVLWIPVAGPIAADIADGIEEPMFTFVCVAWSAAEALGVIFTATGIAKERQQRKGHEVSLLPILRHGNMPGVVCSIGL